MRKYEIVNNNWVWNSNLSNEELFDLEDKDTLLARGKYLTEVVDKIPDILSYRDLEKLPKDYEIVEENYVCSLRKR